MIELARAKAGLSMRALSSGLQVAYNGSALQKNGISRDRMFRLALVLKNKSLEQLAESNIYWDEITNITELGIEEVYDATVAETHNFIANDIIVHNSIEQDADLVMFIHREDKVNMEKARENNSVNMAQLIIAKHRNGPTGQIDFRVDPESLIFMEVDHTHATPSEYI